MNVCTVHAHKKQRTVCAESRKREREREKTVANSLLVQKSAMSRVLHGVYGSRLQHATSDSSDLLDDKKLTVQRMKSF